MRFRVRILARALARALGVTAPGSLMVSTGERGQITQIETRVRWTAEALDQLPAVNVTPEREGPV